jgi:hypothetical protein
MAAVCIIIRPFVLKQKDQKFKADIIGPNAHSGRFPAMSARLAHPTRSVLGVHPDTVVYRRSLEREYYYVECTRMGRKRLAMKTFYKTKIGG